MPTASQPAATPDQVIIDVLGLSVTAKHVAEAVDILQKDHSVAVKQPLQHKDNPLCTANYHSIAEAEYQVYPGLKRPPGSMKVHEPHVKRAFVHYLRRRLVDLGLPAPPSEPMFSIEQAIELAKCEIEDDLFAEPVPLDADDARNRILKQVFVRQGQQGFRAELMKAYSARCAITDCDAEEALEAAHLLPYKGVKSHSMNNGLLLRADIHTLFDLRLMAIDPQTHTVVLAKCLSGTQYKDLAGTPVAKPKHKSQFPDPAVLSMLWQEFAEQESRGSLHEMYTVVGAPLKA